jgi:hypothetical protein
MNTLAEVILVQTCVVCGKMRVDRSGDRSLLIPKGGVKTEACYPCAFWVSRTLTGLKKVLDNPNYPDDGPGAA